MAALMGMTTSPSCSLHEILSSASHFSSNCTRPCASAGRASSSDSTLFRRPASISVEKYLSTGGWPPSGAAHAWKRAMVAAVRSKPPGDAAAHLAAPS